MGPETEEQLREKILLPRNPVAAEAGLSDEVIKVQVALEKEAEKEDEKIHQEALQLVRKNGEEWRDKQMAFLLSKSAMFTKVIEQKMRKQEEQEQNLPDAPKSSRRGRKRKIGGPARPIPKRTRSSQMFSQQLETTPSEPNEVPKLFTKNPDISLRSYQMDGLLWLKTLHMNGMNGILADEMGLGKTVQTVAMVCHLFEMGIPLRGPILLVVPLATLLNWLAEFKRFAPQIPVIFYHGPRPERRQELSKFRCCHDAGGTKFFPVVLTTYEIVIKDSSQLRTYNWPYFVMDEGHRIKNMNCKLLRELKQFNLGNRLLLTGTPLQNNLAELWSLLNFILPEIFQDLNGFEALFDFTGLGDEAADRKLVEEERQSQMVSKLHDILAPMLLRRVKVDVELDLPPKREILVYAPMTPLQLDYYEKAVDISMKKLSSQKNKQTEPSLVVEGKRKKSLVDFRQYFAEEDDEDLSESFGSSSPMPMATPQKQQKEKTYLDCMNSAKNMLMILRKIPMHPYLLEHPKDENGLRFVDKRLVSASGKLRVLDRLLVALKAKGHKVLIFSQMVKMLDILETYCEWRGWNFCRLDGTTGGLDERGRQMKMFNEDSEQFLFLLSTRAGGTGINLQSADTVIIFDSDWNPQIDLQAQDRCHRIGQTRPVLVLRLVVRGTIDEQMLKKAMAKRKLEKMVIKDKRFSMLRDSTPGQKVSPEELLQLLRSTDFSSVVETGNDMQVIADADLEKLLDRTWTKQDSAEQNDKENEESSAFRVVAEIQDELQFDGNPSNV